MTWWQNLPLFQIVCPLICAAVCSALKGKAARAVMTALSVLECVCMGILLYYTSTGNINYVYAMGEIGAPFGNELRIGVTESLVGLAFSLIMLLSILGGWESLSRDVAPSRMNLYGAMICLLTAAMAAMVFTNDLFTAYVFIEISTIAACALICASNQGKTLFAATRYMIMNLMGSGLFLLGLSILYCLTGHLLFPQLGESVIKLLESGQYPIPLYLSFLLMTMGIAVKSALYPFHTWLPDAYGSATSTSSAILSSLISKMYIFLLIKIFLRAAGTEVFALRIEEVLIVYAVLGMIMGSVHAIRQRHFSRMVAYSSVAQIGYIFLGISLGTEAGMAAALYHILAHSAAKSMLFLTTNRLREVSAGDDTFKAIRGAGFRAPLAGLAFTVGACSLVGIPGLGGFASKVYLAQAGVDAGGWRMIVLLSALAISTLLNVAYMLRTVLTLYRQEEGVPTAMVYGGNSVSFAVSMAALMIVNIGLGIFGNEILHLIDQGIRMFA